MLSNNVCFIYVVLSPVVCRKQGQLLLVIKLNNFVAADVKGCAAGCWGVLKCNQTVILILKVVSAAQNHNKWLEIGTNFLRYEMDVVVFFFNILKICTAILKNKIRFETNAK